MSTTCALCRRIIPDERLQDPQAVQEHHLRPELFTNDELRSEYDTINALRSASRLTEYLSWIRGTNRLDINVETSNHVRQQQNR